jgi:putative transposase
MPRKLRRLEAGTIYHVLNRGNGRRRLFAKEKDFVAFLALLGEALRRFPVDLLAFCVLGNHWHLLLRPRTDAALSRMMAWLTVTHARRHHKHYPSPGTGHLYQGRFKSFPVESDEHFLIVARYIHANALRARLVKRAEEWQWSDAAHRHDLPLAEWPVERPRNWLGLINEPLPESTIAAIETSVRRGRPFGSDNWIKRIARRLKLTATLQPIGRPHKPISHLSPRYRKQVERRRECAEKST